MYVTWAITSSRCRHRHRRSHLSC